MTVELPDVPRWVEAHGIASDPEHWRDQVGDGYALGHDAARLIVIAGAADPDAVARLAAARPAHTLLVASEREDVVAAVATVRSSPERATLHTLADPHELPELEGATQLDVLERIPRELASSPLLDELAWAKRRGPVWSVWVDDEPVSFAYAPWRSPKWFEVSVETLASARGLGLASIAAAAMIRDERARGREPVWGADQDNVASLRLARRLGFVAVDEIWVCAHS